MYNAENYRVQRGRTDVNSGRNRSLYEGRAAPSDQFGDNHRVYQTHPPAHVVHADNQNSASYNDGGRYEVQAGRRRQADGSRFIQSHRRPAVGHSEYMVQGNNNPHQQPLRPTYKFGGGAEEPVPQDINAKPQPPCPNPLKGNFADPNHPGKILICHLPPGNLENPQTLSIDPSGLSGHGDHCDDYDGPCDTETPPSSPPSPPGECTFGAPDCAGICGGPNVRDCKGICFDPTKVPPPNTVDCAGVCGGTSEYDCAGKCFDPKKGPPPSIKDCSGVCGGTKVPDCKGVCGGTAAPDCKGVCGGTAFQDCKGVCGGTATVDCKGVCGGTAVRDCNGVCEGNSYKDCNGRCITPNCTFDGGKKSSYNFRPAVQNPRARQRFAPKNE